MRSLACLLALGLLSFGALAEAPVDELPAAELPAAELPADELPADEPHPVDASANTPPRWESPRVPAGAPAPAGLVGMKASDCGVCHQALYAEWQTSIHAHAWTDAQFQGELAKDPEVGWVCLNCHVPAGDQQAEITTTTGDVRAPARAPNPSFDPQWQQEGITCVSCHYRDGSIIGVYGDGPAPHPVVADPEALRSVDLCLGCHQAIARYEDALVCSFNTGQEWREAEQTQTCQSCHMPEVARPVAPGGPERLTRRHLWLGSRIPKDRIEPHEQAYYDMFSPGLAARVELPAAAAPGEEVTGWLSVENAAAGHLLPSGDPERYYLVTVEVTDEAGALVSRTTLRLGQRWRWWPDAQQLADNRLAPGEQRRIPLAFTMPEGGVTARLLAEHYRISPENAEYHGLDDYPIRSVAVDASQRVEVAEAADGG